MTSAPQSRLSGFGRFVSARGFQVLALVVLALVLYGAVPRGRLAWLLGLFVAARWLFLLAEGRRPRFGPGEWQGLEARLREVYARLPAEEREQDALLYRLPAAAPPEALARAAVADRRSRSVAPRSGRELVCEGLGVLAFGVLLPLVALLYSHDFVSARRSLGWLGLGTVAGSLALYAWPHFWGGSVRLARRRMLWWALPAAPALVLIAVGLGLRHPYLDPTRPDRVQLAAERVLALEDVVVAGAHADWVFAWAQQLERRGEPEQAARRYREGLRLDPTAQAARARLALLEAGRAPRPEAPALPGFVNAEERARAPLWSEGDRAPQLRSCQVDDSLEQVDGTVVVLVRVGDVPRRLLDPVGEVIRRELGLPVCLSGQSVPLPSHTRMRGLAVGPQWSLRSIAQSFLYTVESLPESPAKYVLVTNADVYAGEANFVFSGTYGWGAIVSYARLGDVPADSGEMVNRTAKQSLGALVQSFGVRKSPDPRCVTSYSNGLPQFDAKGNRPSAETMALFQRALQGRNRGWAAHREALVAGGG